MILIDTGFFIALNNPKDPEHKNAKCAFQKHSRSKFITTWPVMTEVCHLLLRDRPKAVQSFLKAYEHGGFEIFHLNKEHNTRLCELLETYHELPMDVADASLVILAEALGHGKIMTTDRRDFSAYRWAKKNHFENLLVNAK